MESTNELSNLNNFTYTGKNAPLSPFPFPLTSSCPDSAAFKPKGNPRLLEVQAHHQRCSSESFLTEEQPPWVEDLLSESETIVHRGHRRSASDSFAYFEAPETFNREESKYGNVYTGNSTRSKNIVHYKDFDSTFSVDTKASSFSKRTIQESEEVISKLGVEQSRKESSSHNLHEGSADRASGSQVKPSGAKTDAKRAKQHNAHRSRVRKLQYIAYLERTVQILQNEGSEVSAELEFLEKQNIILIMENRSLRQRLESTSQEQIIKQWEQEMLEREIGRLKNLYHQQQIQMHNQQQQQKQQHPRRRNRSRDFDQANSSPMNSKDSSSSKGSVRM